jgi:hypothetical protein
VGHDADDIAGLVADRGDVPQRPIGVAPDVAGDNPVLGLEFVERVGVRHKPTFAVLDGNKILLTRLEGVYPHRVRRSDPQTLVDDPTLPKTIAQLTRTLGRLERILGGGEADLTVTVENLRQITDNLRDLTEDAKRYPANVIFGGPPKPLESQQR